MSKDNILRESDVVVIGSGIIGMSIARELARYQVDVTVIEKEADVAMGISKTAGSLIYMGLFQALSLVIKDLGKGMDLEAETKTERMKMLWGGFRDFDRIAHDLDIAHKHVGLLIIARNSDEVEKLRRLERLAQFVPGGTVKKVSRDELFQMEPNITPDAVEGLYDSTGTVSMFGPEYVIAVYENARENGAHVLFNTECVGIEKKGENHFVKTSKGTIKARRVINCAGKYADRIADMADARSGWNLVFYRSQALILDKKVKGTISHIVGIPPDAGKIDFLYPMEEGNIHVYGGNYDLIEDREFTETTRENFDDAISRMKKLVPCLSEKHIITSYVGVRTFNDKEFEENLIEYAPGDPNFINVLVRMPGFTPAPRVARKVVDMVKQSGMALSEKEHFNPKRQSIPRFRYLTDAEKERLIKEDDRYGSVVCRCETVTEGEIVEAVRRGATTLQGIMFRTRSGMGRCQRNWCGPKIMEIMARELGKTKGSITYKGNGFTLATD
ncbi:MAG: FAD-dependent oxidoreductase [Desulfobacterales bacterium]|nr:FAD-dependent oxidoreductase [Desulfobacterales bacterium]